MTPSFRASRTWAIATAIAAVTAAAATAAPAGAALPPSGSAGRAGATAAAAATPAEGGALALVALQPSVEATDELQWRVPLALTTRASHGLYFDSLWVEVVPHVAPDARGTGATRQSLQGLVRSIEAVAPGDTVSFLYTAPAFAEHATLRFGAAAHDARGGTHRAAVEVRVEPGPWSRAHPSVTVEAGGRAVETVLVPAEDAAGPAPGVLLVHGHGASARDMLGMARLLARRGLAAMLVSMPGYGASAGPPDFMGPATLAAAEAALERLRAAPGVDSTRLGAWGISRGATVVAELAARRPDLDAAIVQAGIYDLWAEYRGTRLDGIRELILAEAGRDSAAWGARSPILRAGRVRAAVLVIHGERDPRVPVDQARAYEAALRAAGVEVESRFFPDAGHSVPRAEGNRAALDFLRRRLGG